MKKRKPRTRPETPRQAALRDRWRKSPEWRALARKGAYIALRKFAARPKCGAKTRVTGDPCRGIAMENGRCYRHGGRTPKGDAWHKPTFPLPADRFAAKAADLQRRAAKQEQRRQEMTCEELERHKRWHETHTPGPKTARASRRDERRRTEEARAMLSSPRREPEPSPEARELEALIDRLRAHLNELDAPESAKHGGLFD
ncbi:hypothetical protein [Methylocystis parvus]|uniref:hypothetical protein n=1 Tax=Methylocystis parvus TaxID=134 RepID=UPI003C74DB0C